MLGILGIVAAFAVLIGGALSDGDPLTSLVSATATIIVFGGTFAALLTQFGFGHIMIAAKGLKWVVAPPKSDMPAFVEAIGGWANIARSQGTLALEASLNSVTDEFQKKGLQLIIDNTPVAEMLPLMGALSENAGRDEKVPGEVWEAAGGYLPTIGVMGAVLGLIHVMLRLDHPEELGAGVATAFVATIYGVGAANLIFLPLGTRLSGVAEGLERNRNVVIQGFLLLAEGKPGISIRQSLQALLPKAHGKAKAAAADGEPAGAVAGEAA